MANITTKQIHRSYELGLEVFKEVRTFKDAHALLVKETDMNSSSAAGYIQKVGVLLRGERYTRTFNFEAAQFFLQKIQVDLPISFLANALKSMREHIAYYEIKSKTGFKNPKLLALIQSYEARLAQNPTPMIELQIELDKQTAIALKLDPDELKRRAEAVEGTPTTVSVTTTVFIRNPTIRANALLQAKGVCGGCGKFAPFNRTDGSPFLEVHHKIPLAEGGKDEAINTVALCPNCHREAHFGAEWQKFRIISP
jgi:5-methylcytosine-specific restriction enzyme A